MTTMSFDKWLKCIKHVNEWSLSHSERDSLFEEFLNSKQSGRVSHRSDTHTSNRVGKMGKNNKNSRKSANVQVDNIALSEKADDSNNSNNAAIRNKWVSDYFGYVYNKASSKQKSYFDKEFDRYRGRKFFAVSPMPESEWFTVYVPILKYCSEEIQNSIHSEYEWFNTVTWVYQPMHMNDFALLFFGVKLSNLEHAQPNMLELICKDFFSYLHDCAADKEDIWIDKLAPREVIPGKPVSWQELGITTDEYGNPTRSTELYGDRCG